MGGGTTSQAGSDHLFTPSKCVFRQGKNRFNSSIRPSGWRLKVNSPRRKRMCEVLHDGTYFWLTLNKQKLLTVLHSTGLWCDTVQSRARERGVCSHSYTHLAVKTTLTGSELPVSVRIRKRKFLRLAGSEARQWTVG